MITTQAHKIQFSVNPAKALESLVYVISKRSGGVNVYNAIKSLYAADKDHLNRHGRPVTGDTYVRMEHGTVPSFIYDIVKKDMLTLMDLGIESPPFTQDGHKLVPSRSADLKHLSKSDIESLDRGCDEYLDLDFSDVKKKNHKERGWIETDPNRPIEFELLIDDEEMLNYLRSIPFKQAV